LSKPPYGLRQGTIPVLLVCAILERRNEIALYDQGTFVPEIRIPEIERLLRMPGNFEIQQYASGGIEGQVLTVLADKLFSLRILDKGTEEKGLLAIVKPLILFVTKLPIYVKKTRRINSREALAVRDSLLKARDPNSLIFKDLPNSVGVKLKDKSSAEAFVAKLASAINALQRAYPNFLDEIEMQLRHELGFNEKEKSETVRKSIQARALPLVGRTADPWLGTVIRETAQIGEQDWREVLGRVINKGNPVHQWEDSEINTFQINLDRISKEFFRLEEMVSEQTKTGASEILRVGILNGMASETRAVISISREGAADVIELTRKINQLLMKENVTDRQVRIAALAKVVAQHIDNGTDKNKSFKEVVVA